MRIDFREICETGNDNIDYLACGGTKIKMAVDKVFITPIEQRINNPQIKFPSKRYDRTFLTDDICASFQRREEMNDNLLYLAKIVLNELPTNEKLNAEISHCRNAILVSVFSERAKPLLLQHLHGDGLHGLEKNLIAKFLKLLRYDCTIDLILPYNISDPIRKYIKAYKKDTCLEGHTNELISLFKKFSLELASLLMFPEKFYSKPSEKLILFLEYLNDRVIGMYQNKIAPAQA